MMTAYERLQAARAQDRPTSRAYKMCIRDRKALCLRLWQVFLWGKSPHWLLQAHTALKMGSVWLAREG